MHQTKRQMNLINIVIAHYTQTEERPNNGAKIKKEKRVGTVENNSIWALVNWAGGSCTPIICTLIKWYLGFDEVVNIKMLLHAFAPNSGRSVQMANNILCPRVFRERGFRSMHMCVMCFSSRRWFIFRCCELHAAAAAVVAPTSAKHVIFCVRNFPDMHMPVKYFRYNTTHRTGRSAQAPKWFITNIFDVRWFAQNDGWQRRTSQWYTQKKSTHESQRSRHPTDCESAEWAKRATHFTAYAPPQRDTF